MLYIYTDSSSHASHTEILTLFRTVYPVKPYLYLVVILIQQRKGIPVSHFHNPAAAVKEAIVAGMKVTDFDPNKPFSFKDHPALRRKIDRIMKDFARNLEMTVSKGITESFALANKKNDELTNNVLADSGYNISDKIKNKYFTPAGVDVFLKRKTNGLRLSERVWNYSNQFEKEIEAVLDAGLRKGRSATGMATDLQQYLRHPDRMYRRFLYRSGTDENGNALYGRKWEQRYVDENGKVRFREVDLNSPEHKPGRGIYRSSYKNARRMAVTEVNAAYATADYERWQKLDFVVGIEVHLSGNHTLNGETFHLVEKLLAICSRALPKGGK